MTAKLSLPGSWLFLILLASACFNPSFESAPACMSDGECQSGQQCDLAYHRCRGNGVPADGGPDGPGNVDGADGPVPEVVMVTVAAGPFMRGCASADADCDLDEQDAHLITLSAFEIDQTEVTVAAYRECIEGGPCQPPFANFSAATPGDLPVRNVTWDQATAYCAWKGKRLPTEAEWEKAARGTDARIWPWGSAPVPDCSHANFTDCPVSDPEPVGILPNGQSPYGAFDMAGNVSEWVSDWYSAGYFNLIGDATDPTGPAMADAACPSGITSTTRCRVIRGGRYNNRAADIRAGDRQPNDPALNYDVVGFRCAK